jgi:hypothetical protein
MPPFPDHHVAEDVSPRTVMLYKDFGSPMASGPPDYFKLQTIRRQMRSMASQSPRSGARRFGCDYPRREASAAPSTRLPNLAQTMSGSMTPKPAKVEKPQSVPAMTRSLPTIRV